MSYIQETFTMKLSSQTSRMHDFFSNVIHTLLRDLAPLVGGMIIDLPASSPRDGTSGIKVTSENSDLKP
jgi:hypothetical protein